MDFDIQQIMVGFLAITISLTVHEFAHAIVAHRLGDPTPGEHGRLTLNPMVLWVNYPVGALVAPILGAFSGFLMGWAATPVSPHKVRRGISVRQADLLISVAGPVSNVLLAVVSIALVATTYRWTGPGTDSLLTPLGALFWFMVQANVLLAVFNMLPIPPLDGFHVLRATAPRSWDSALESLEQFGMILLLLVIFRGGVIFGPVFTAAADVTHWAIRLVNG